MRQRIKDFFEKISRIEKGIFKMFCVMILINALYLASYLITENADVAKALTIRTIYGLAVVTLVIASIVFVTAVIFNFGITKDNKNEYGNSFIVKLMEENKYWDLFTVQLIEGVVYLALLYHVPYATVLVLGIYMALVLYNVFIGPKQEKNSNK